MRSARQRAARALRPAYLLARADQATRLGLLARIAPRQTRNPAARNRFYRFGYQDPAALPDDIARAWLEPLLASPKLATQYLRMFTSIRPPDLLAVEPALTRLKVPTLVVWGTGDKFFHRSWAYWLRDTIPGVTEVVELDDARLLFPDERATELTIALRRHWDAHESTGAEQDNSTGIAAEYETIDAAAPSDDVEALVADNDAGGVRGAGSVASSGPGDPRRL